MEASSEVNSDLARERSRATFDKENLTNFLYGGPAAVRKKRYLGKIVNGSMNRGQKTERCPLLIILANPMLYTIRHLLNCPFKENKVLHVYLLL